MSSRPADPGSSPGGRRAVRTHGRPQTDEPSVQRITSAPEPHSADLDRRMSRYLWQMGIRTACFIGAYFASGWLQWVLLIGAIVLPYIAVVLANNGTISNGEILGPIPDQQPAPQPALEALSTGSAGRPDDGPVQGVVWVTPALPRGQGTATPTSPEGNGDGDNA